MRTLTPKRPHGRARGRFDVVVVFASGASVRITSDKTRSLAPAEIVTALREFLEAIERGIDADRAQRNHPLE